MSRDRDFPAQCAIRGCLAPSTIGVPYRVTPGPAGARQANTGLCERHAAALAAAETELVAARVRAWISLTSGVEAATPAIVPPVKPDG